MRGDEVLTVQPGGILSNDTDVDVDVLTARLVRGPLHGELVLHADGSFVYKPDPSFIGVDTFTYVATDGDADSQRTHVAINVLVPSSPVDPNTEHSNNDTSSGNSGPQGPPGAGTPLDALGLHVVSNAELPSTVSEREHAEQLPTREMQQRHNDPEDSADAALTTIDPGYLSLAEHDAYWVRPAARSRTADDVIETVLATIETVPLPTTADVIAPLVTAAQTELADLGALLNDHSLLQRWMIGSAVGVTTGLTVGYVFWTVRAGYLLTGLIAQVPAWRFVDPLPILGSLAGAAGPGDAESLASIAEASGNDTSLTS